MSEPSSGEKEESGDEKVLTDIAKNKAGEEDRIDLVANGGASDPGAETGECDADHARHAHSPQLEHK